MRDTTAADSWARNYWNILEKCVDWSSFQTLSAIQTLGQSMGSSMADQDILIRPGDAPAPVAVAPVAPVAGPAHVRPKPLWQPWSDSDGKANRIFFLFLQENSSGLFCSKICAWLDILLEWQLQETHFAHLSSLLLPQSPFFQVSFFLGSSGGLPRPRKILGGSE